MVGEQGTGGNQAPYAAGLRTPAREYDGVALPVEGTLPPWLSGTLLRNGPACFEVGDRSFRHWFDGQAMIHRFHVAAAGDASGDADGDATGVTYTNRYLATPARTAALANGRITYGEFATDPCRSIFQRLFTLFTPPPPSGNTNVNIVQFGERTLALTETPLPVEFDPGTLETVGVQDYEDHLGAPVTTAHPHLEPGRGHLVNYSVRFARTCRYLIHRQRAESSALREVVAEKQVTHPSYMHSFAITPSYAVLVEFPYRVNPLALLLSGRPFIENYRWQPDDPTRITLLSLTDGTVAGEYEAPAMFAFHHINAYEEDGADGTVVLDLCAYPDPEIVQALYLDRLRSGGPVPQALPTRLRVDRRTGRVTVTRLSDEPLELPRIDYRRHNGHPYRYTYGVGSRDHGGGDFFDQLVKLDVSSGETLTWHEPGGYPGEPVFVAAPKDTGGDAGEDSGVILSVVLDSAAQSSYLLVLDAVSFTELARARVPQPVPFGFHGVFSRG
ncbi:carotenoid oxygenase family protein [Streptomyces pseudovenezuelae]|uniref:Dioxygenase n=1 Tax=Streptomyces pseudovenezuelae TaxID=67350 RepID=A0ABT6LGT1_9ACTN|nr:carotenoid oxygenase family protein [Streptomyces pseudovenezuelae]MDH6215499.1 beta,beta-carotene 9',10'-dioxygenase [Streptomyces pseudovenezuelae]